MLACGLSLNLASERVMLIGVLKLNWLTLSLYIIRVPIKVVFKLTVPINFTLTDQLGILQDGTAFALTPCMI
jgi:hypothetical protein